MYVHENHSNKPSIRFWWLSDTLLPDFLIFFFLSFFVLFNLYETQFQRQREGALAQFLMLSNWTHGLQPSVSKAHAFSLHHAGAPHLQSCQNSHSLFQSFSANHPWGSDRHWWGSIKDRADRNRWKEKSLGDIIWPVALISLLIEASLPQVIES